MGPTAKRTAEHFCHHVVEFCEKHDVAAPRVYTKELQTRWEAILECDEQHMILIRDHLKPKRAERLEPL